MPSIGRYEILGELGRGAMGIVYRAQDPAIGRTVAIKTIRLSDFSDLDELQRLKERLFREARSAGMLSHPHIVTIYDIFEDGQTAVIAMEFVNGPTLAHLMSQSRAPDKTLILTVLRDVAAALDYAHQKGIVHRDVKPANIMIQDDGTAKITDFGVAKILSHQVTRADAFLGTPSYMSPEQIQAKALDGRSDQFALAVIACELLTGEKPFSGDSLPSLLYRIVNEDPISPQSLNPTLGPEVERVFKKALAKDPAARFEHCSGFIAALTEALQARPGWHSVPRSGSTGATSAEKSAATIIQPALSTAALEAEPVLVAGGDFTGLFTKAAQSAGSPAPPEVALVVTQCSDPSLVGKRSPLKRFPFSIGRAEGDLTIRSDPGLSRSHATLEFLNGAVNLRDCGSRNGVYLNGRRLLADRPEPLMFGDVIRLSATTTVTFVSDEQPELPDLTGRTIENRFRLTRLLHSSSKSALYAAEDRKLPRSVAVKLLSPQLAAYPGYREQFRREAEIAARLRHPHIAKMIDFGESSLVLGELGPPESVPYLCMELIEQGSLADRLVFMDQPLPLERVTAWIARLADALDYAHREGIIHCGIKPSSIVFDRQENPYLTDFATATPLGGSGGRAVIGAPAFLAPEQWEGLEPAPATDQYALAALAYLAITGSRPYENQENPDVRKRNFARGPLPAHEEAQRNGRPGVPPLVSGVLKRAMALKPEERFDSTNDFAAALQASMRRERAPSGKPRIFVSYQRDSSAGWAVLFARELDKRHDISAYVDTERLDSAVRFPVRIQRAIEDCDVFVCLLAAPTLTSTWVLKEIQFAFEHGKPMVPVFQESFSFPDAGQAVEPHVEALLSYDGVHLLDRRNIHVDHTIADLSELVKRTIGRLRRDAAGA